MSSVELIDETGRFREQRRLRRVLDRLAEQLLDEGQSLTVVIIDDPTMAERNRHERGVLEATDVLSFPLNEPDDEGHPQVPHLGDIFISLDTAGRAARSHGHRRWHEVAMLAAHGWLHLLGHDHQTENDWPPFHLAARWALTEAEAVDQAENLLAALSRKDP
jgi:probable rRNA maturation factor